MSGTPRDDIRKARTGDREALNRLLVRVHGRVTRRALTRLGPALQARLRISDLVQSTYLDVVRYIGEFDGESDDAFAAWVGRILENNIRDKRRFYAASKRATDPAGPQEIEDASATLRGNPSEDAAVEDELRLVNRALEELPAHYQEIIRLRIMQGRRYDEIGSRLGRTASSARVLLARARAALILRIDRLRAPAP